MLEAMGLRKHTLISALLATSVVLGSAVSLPSAEAAAKPTYDKKMQMGQLLYFNGNVDQAIKAFKTAASLKPEAFEPHLNLVNIYVQRQDFQSAIEECKAGLQIKPNHRDLHLIHANLLRSHSGTKEQAEQKAMLEDALKSLGKAEELGANKALVYNTLGIIFVQLGDLDKALEYVNKALDVNAKMPDAHLIKGVLLFKKGDKENSIKEIDLAIKQKDKNAEAHNTKADILFSMGKETESMAEYKLAIADESKFYQSYVGLANILIKQGKFDEALEHLIKADQVHPNDANIIYSVAVCLEKLGKIHEAIQKFDEGVMVDTNVTMKNQIMQHLQQLRGAGRGFSLPGIGQAGMGPNFGGPGNNIFKDPFFGESFKDMIKIKQPPAAAKEEK